MLLPQHPDGRLNFGFQIRKRLKTAVFRNVKISTFPIISQKRKKIDGLLKGFLFNISTYECDEISINIHIFRDKIGPKRGKDDLKVDVSKFFG